MFVLRCSTHLTGSVEDVFAYVSDFRHAPDWQRQLSAIRMEGGLFPDGTHVVEVRTMLGRQFEAHGELVEWDPPHGLVVRGSSGLLSVESRYSFEAAGGDTRLGLTLTVEGHGPMRLAEPLLGRVFRHQAQGDLARLAAVLNGRPSPARVVLNRVSRVG